MQGQAAWAQGQAAWAQGLVSWLQGQPAWVQGQPAWVQGQVAWMQGQVACAWVQERVAWSPGAAAGVPGEFAWEPELAASSVLSSQAWPGSWSWGCSESGTAAPSESSAAAGRERGIRSWRPCRPSRGWRQSRRRTWRRRGLAEGQFASDVIKSFGILYPLVPLPHSHCHTPATD